MSHSKEEQISAYLDGQLARDESHELELHLRDCPGCRASFEEMRELNRLFREAERLEPSPFLWTRIAAGFEKERVPVRGWRENILAGLSSLGLKPGMAAAAMGILIFAGIAVYREININIADRAALVEIDKTRQSLAAQDPDAYNPFSFSSPRDLDANPFRSMRLSGRIHSASPGTGGAETE